MMRNLRRKEETRDYYSNTEYSNCGTALNVMDGRLRVSVRRPACRSAASPLSRAQDKDPGGKIGRREPTATIALKVAATMPLEGMPVDRERYSTPPWPY